MPNPPFTADQLTVLTGAQRWRLISTIIPPESDAVARRGRVDRHAHPHQEVLIPLSGGGSYGHGEQAYPCVPGAVYLFDRFEPHDNGYGPDVRDALHLWVSIVEDRAFARTMRIAGGRMTAGAFACAVRPDDLALDLQRTFADARRLASGAPALSRARVVGAIAAIVACVAHDGTSREPREHGSLQEQAIDAITRHIAQTAGNGVTLEHLARIAGFSKFHFLRLFKKRTGKTVHQYVDDCRLQRVAELRIRGLAQKEIGERLGFSCPAAFSRWYRGKR
jgi:AraC-like DNA-binding protein